MMVPATMRVRLLLVSLARRVVNAQEPRVRHFHASTTVLARQSRRGGRAARGTSAVPSPFEDARDSDDEDADDNSEPTKKSKKTATFFTMGELDENPDLMGSNVDGEDDEHEDDDDEETKDFLKGVEELFALEPKAFEKRLVTMDPESESASHRFEEGDDVDHGDSDDEEEEEEIDRAERIPKKRLLKVLDDFDAMKPRGGKNTEGMAIPKTKMAAPLEKKVKKIDPDRISHRQERVEMTVVEFVQNLLLEDSDQMETDVVAHLVEASVSPDLRRVVLYWEPVRRNSENLVIAKKKTEGVQKRLEKLEKWVRMSVTRHLNLKYSPIVQFKRYKQPKSDEARAAFDKEMAWLERFK